MHIIIDKLPSKALPWVRRVQPSRRMARPRLVQRASSTAVRLPSKSTACTAPHLARAAGPGRATPLCAARRAQGAGGGQSQPEEVELPWPEYPHPDPNEPALPVLNPPEPENPMPDVPPNHPAPEVRLLRRRGSGALWCRCRGRPVAQQMQQARLADECMPHAGGAQYAPARARDPAAAPAGHAAAPPSRGEAPCGTGPWGGGPAWIWHQGGRAPFMLQPASPEPPPSNSFCPPLQHPRRHPRRYCCRQLCPFCRARRSSLPPPLPRSFSPGPTRSTQERSLPSSRHHSTSGLALVAGVAVLVANVARAGARPRLRARDMRLARELRFWRPAGRLDLWQRWPREPLLGAEAARMPMPSDPGSASNS
jgi:hypothetical protein